MKGCEKQLVTIGNCARCGGQHPHLEFSKLTRPMEGKWCYWAACPANGEPILMKAWNPDKRGTR